MTRDDDAYAAFVAARWSSLYRTSYLLTGDATQAEDLLQTALLKTYVAWRRVEAAAAPEAYVRTVLVNSLISAKRKKSSGELTLAALPETPVGSHEEGVVERSSMWQGVRRLPPRQRAVVVLRYYEDLSMQQIAQILGCSVGTVKSQASDALRSLRRAFAGPDAAAPEASAPDAASPTNGEA